MVDMLDYIDFKEVEALNANPSHNIGNALKQVNTSANQLTSQGSQIWLVGAHQRQQQHRTTDPHLCCRATGKTTACTWSPTRMSSCSYTSLSCKVSPIAPPAP